MKKVYRLSGLIILVIIFTKIDFKKLASCFSQINLLMFMLVNFITLPSLFIKSLRWRYILKIQGVDYSVTSSFFSYLGGICAGIITPGRAGEAMRAVYLKEDKRVPLSQGLASVFVDRIFDLSVLLIFSAAGLCFLHRPDLSSTRIVFIYLVVLVLLVIVFSRRSILYSFLKKIYLSVFSGLGARVLADNLRRFIACIKDTLASRKIYVVFFLTALAYTFYFVQCCLLARIAHINIHWIIVIFFVSIASLLAMLPLTILGLGTREASLVFLFSLVGVKSEVALTYSFLLFFSFYILIGFLGYLGWLFKYQAKRAIAINE